MPETERSTCADRVDVHVMAVRPADRSQKRRGDIPFSPEVGPTRAGLEVVILEQAVKLVVSLRIWLDVVRKSKEMVCSDASASVTVRGRASCPFQRAVTS